MKIGFYEKLSAAASPAARLHDAAGSSTDERTARNAAGNGTTTATADVAASLYADAGLDSVCSVSGNPLFVLLKDFSHFVPKVTFISPEFKTGIASLAIKLVIVVEHLKR